MTKKINYRGFNSVFCECPACDCRAHTIKEVEFDNAGYLYFTAECDACDTVYFFTLVVTEEASDYEIVSKGTDLDEQARCDTQELTNYYSSQRI